MDEYIKRDVVTKGIMAAKWVDGYDGAMAMEIAASAPAADVAPVVHGQWIFGELGPVGCTVRCSACGWGINSVDPVLWMDYVGHKYCGSCGAKMDGGGSDAAD